MRAWLPRRVRFLAGDPRVTIRRCRFEAFAATASEGETDLITMVAVLHHLDLDGTLDQIPRLLAPGGRLLVVGLAKVDSLADTAIDLVSSAANPVMGLIKHPRPVDLAEQADDWSAVNAGPRSHRDLRPDRYGCPRPPARQRDPSPAVLPVHPSLGQAAITMPVAEAKSPVLSPDLCPCNSGQISKVADVAVGRQLPIGHIACQRMALASFSASVISASIFARFCAAA